MTKEDFEENYLMELTEQLNDNDSTVKLKALQSAGKLSKNGYINLDVFQHEIWPVFLRMVETTFDEDQSLHLFAKMFGEFLFEVSEIDEQFIAL
jgi:hypothetical protein